MAAGKRGLVALRAVHACDFCNTPPPQVAKGRVWTGRQALERGLIDRLGGLHDAVVAAKEAVRRGRAGRRAGTVCLCAQAHNSAALKSAALIRARPRPQAGLPVDDEAAVDVRTVWPPRRSPVAELFKLLGTQASPAVAAALLAAAALQGSDGSGAAGWLQAAAAGAGLDGSLQMRSWEADVDVQC